MKQNSQMELEALRDYIRMQNEYVEKVRGVKHDMAAHLLVLKYYLTDQKYEDAKVYIDRLLGENECIRNEVIQLGNDLVEAVVTGCLRRSKTEIDIRCEGMVPETLQMEDRDLCTLFSNVMSNAVEACERLCEQSKVIRMKLFRDGGDWHIEVANPVEWKVSEEILGKGTTKEDSEYHGYGIRNIRNVVKNYDGIVNFDVTDAGFCVEIILRDVVK